MKKHGVVIKNLQTKKDYRGWLIELIRPEDVKNKLFGQVLVTAAYPGQTKGGHYHAKKTEWYCAIKGEGLLTITNIKTEKSVTYKLGEKNIKLVKIPPNYAHSIKNIGKEEMLVIAYVDEAFSAMDPDTFPFEVGSL